MKKEIDYKEVWQFQKAKREERKKLLLESPIKEYVDFIIYKVERLFDLREGELIKRKKPEYILIPRYIAIKVINELTGLGADVMYFVGRDTTTYGNATRETEGFLAKESYMSSYKILVESCDVIAFENYKSGKILNHTWETYKQIDNQL